MFAKRTLGFLAALGTAVYGVMLLAVSLSSREIVLEPGRTLRFCGAYIDCHLGASVAGMSHRPVATGEQYVIQVSISNSARRATLAASGLQAELTDDSGATYRSQSGPDSITVSAGQGVVVDFVYTMPGPRRGLRLHITEGGRLGRLLERFLVGDSESLLHQPVVLSVGE